MLHQPHRCATALIGWIIAATTTGLPGISTFAQQLTADLDAVTA